MFRAKHGKGLGLEPQSDRIKTSDSKPDTKKQLAETLDLPWTTTAKSYRLPCQHDHSTIEKLLITTQPINH